MNGKDILDIIDCIRNNDTLSTERTVELIDLTMRDCKAKEVGSLLINTLKKKEKKIKKTQAKGYIETMPKPRKKYEHSEEFKKKILEKKELTENQLALIKNQKENGNRE